MALLRSGAGIAVWLVSNMVAMGAPPVTLHDEGREVDPVAQAFYLTEVPRGGYVCPLPDSSRTKQWATNMWETAWELLLWQLSMPLGPAALDNTVNPGM
ncbi:MAG: hypothetical protein NZ703_02660 [Gemmataceae bacterium]|nr:hypothetical protein [Gemmataceae bacterium]MCS7269962.1 hypothetical protein [Gemmataceae bacterium]MDW8244237.1 hypothetical protein [Thermogemmata sp.]